MKLSRFKNLKRNSENLQKSQGGTNMQSSNVLVKTDMLGDQFNTPTLKNTVQSNTLRLISRIALLPLTTFIRIICDKDFNLIVIDGSPTEQELSDGWNSLMSQYYSARQDESKKEYQELVWRMQVLRVRAEIINLLLNSIGMIYSPTLIEAIKNLDEEFSQFTFADDTIDDDLECIRNIEKNNTVEYSSLSEELKLMEISLGFRDSDGNAVECASITEESFYQEVSTYNEVFKTSLSVENMSTMTFAINCKRWREHIERLNSEKNGAR